MAVHQRNAQRHPGEGHREVITGSFGYPQGSLDLAHRRIVGPQHASRYSRAVDPGDNRGVKAIANGDPKMKVPLEASPSARSITLCDHRTASDHSALSTLA